MNLVHRRQPVIRASKQQTGIVVWNILHEAINFSPIEGEISVAVHILSGAVFQLVWAPVALLPYTTSTVNRSVNSSISISVALPFMPVTRSSETACTSC